MKWLVSRKDALALADMVRKLINVSTIRPGQRIQRGENTTGRALLAPGQNSLDRAVYPAYWVRDPAWVAESGFIPAEEVWGWITLMSETLRGPEPWHLASGGIVMPYSLADHINIDGSPVYYPGTYASDETQGPPWGKYPPHDDQYWLTFAAHAYAQMTGDWRSFGRPVPTPLGSTPLWRACELTHNAFPVDSVTQLCVASDDLNDHIVDWGYNDTITKTGKLLFPSLLRLESALKLADLFERIGETQKAAEYRQQGATIRAAIVPTFLEDNGNEGWLMSATGLGHKPDVWGTALAVYRGFVDDDIAEALGRSLLRGYQERTTVLRGQVRHIPTTAGFWERAQCREGTYQNGGYWGYPTGWYVYALSLVNEQAASEVLTEFLDDLRSTWSDDLSACAWECINPALSHYQNPGYLTTVALPYVALKRKGLLR